MTYGAAPLRGRGSRSGMVTMEVLSAFSALGLKGVMDQVPGAVGGKGEAPVECGCH